MAQKQQSNIELPAGWKSAVKQYAARIDVPMWAVYCAALEVLLRLPPERAASICQAFAMVKHAELADLQPGQASASIDAMLARMRGAVAESAPGTAPGAPKRRGQ